MSNPLMTRRQFGYALGGALCATTPGFLSAATSRPPARPRSFFGVNADPVYDFDPSEYPRLAQVLTDLGAGSVRLPLRWIVVEADRGNWNWASLDAALIALPRRIQVLGMLMSTPYWSTGVDPKNCQGWPDTYPPRDLDDWANFVHSTVSRYRSRIMHWEIWNEENGIDFYHPLPNAKQYVELLKTARRAAKSADPRCKIVLGGLQMNGVVANPWSKVKTPDFLRDIYLAGGGKLFDICNIHPYVLPAEGAAHFSDLIRGSREVMTKFKDGQKPLWITEMGCGLNNGTTESDQAKLLHDCYGAAIANPNVERFFWFTLRDLKKDLLGPESSMGLLTHDWQPKPAYQAFKTIANAKH